MEVMKSGKIIFLKVELIGFINGLDVGCDRKRRVKIDQHFFVLGISKNGVAIY